MKLCSSLPGLSQSYKLNLGAKQISKWLLLFMYRRNVQVFVSQSGADRPQAGLSAAAVSHRLCGKPIKVNATSDSAVLYIYFKTTLKNKLILFFFELKYKSNVIVFYRAPRAHRESLGGWIQSGQPASLWAHRHLGSPQVTVLRP